MPIEGPERQEVINKGQSAYRRTRASRSYQQRPECLLKDQSIKKVINKGQSAYRKTRASTSYQQKPERLPKDQSVKKVINKGQSAYRRTRASKSYQQRPDNQNGVDNKNDQEDGNHTRIGHSYTMVVPMNISSHREAGDLIVEINKQQEEGRTRPLIRTTRRCKRQTTRQHTTRRLRHLMHDKH